ncbi:MAG: MlaD family protein [Prevotellaceae bacterium]|jgi:phospholipid/cholesterol/gamma-HCH transport system substrate-binding protein|nr:MlaD family protein [Prevotellaceae bacterium]
MKLKISKEVKIGIYAITILVVMYWIFNFLKGRDLFNTYNTYYATYENVEGLTQSAPVFLKGLKVGSVIKIVFEKEEQSFLVTLRVDNHYGIPEHSTAEIYAADIMGTKAIRILVSNSPKLAQSKEYLKSSVASDMMTMMVNELTPIKNKLDVLLSNLNVTVETINHILNEEKQRELDESIRSLNKTMKHIERIAGVVDAQKDHLGNTLENADAFTASLRNSTQHIESVIQNLEQISDSLAQSNLKGTVERLNLLLVQVSDTTGTVGQLLYNDELYQRLSITLKDLDALINDLRANPKKYVKLSLF